MSRESPLLGGRGGREKESQRERIQRGVGHMLYFLGWASRRKSEKKHKEGGASFLPDNMQ